MKTGHFSFTMFGILLRKKNYVKRCHRTGTALTNLWKVFLKNELEEILQIDKKKHWCGMAYLKKNTQKHWCRKAYLKKNTQKHWCREKHTLKRTHKNIDAKKVYLKNWTQKTFDAKKHTLIKKNTQKRWRKKSIT